MARLNNRSDMPMPNITQYYLLQHIFDIIQFLYKIIHQGFLFFVFFFFQTRCSA